MRIVKKIREVFEVPLSDMCKIEDLPSEEYAKRVREFLDKAAVKRIEVTTAVFDMEMDWAPIFERLSNEQAGQLIKLIFAFQKDESYVVPNDPELSAAFSFIKQAMVEDKRHPYRS